jgi:hypothetical protein
LPRSGSRRCACSVVFEFDSGLDFPNLVRERSRWPCVLGAWRVLICP